MFVVVRQMVMEEGVMVAEAGQCIFGLKAWATLKTKLVAAKKPARFMTNSRPLGKELNRKCDHTHEHQCFVDGRAASAARYPEEPRRPICRGIAKEKM